MRTNLNFKELLFTQEEIENRVKELATQLNQKFAGSTNVVVVSVLEGGLVFFTDLLKNLELECFLDFVMVKKNPQNQSEVSLVKEVDANLEGRDVVLVDTLCSTGVTLDFLKTLVLNRGANSLTTVVLLNQSSARSVETQLDLVGFEVGEGSISGYGLENKENFNQYVNFVGVRN